MDLVRAGERKEGLKRRGECGIGGTFDCNSLETEALHLKYFIVSQEFFSSVNFSVKLDWDFLGSALTSGSPLHWHNVLFC